MSIEAKRGCGFRKVGGLYLVGDGLGVTCDRLPYSVGVCRVCGEGIRPARGVRWLDGKEFFGGNCKALIRDVDSGQLEGYLGSPCHELHCPICYSDELSLVGLMWVGEKFYPTPEVFEQESARLGVSKRISAVPKEIEIGKTWILLVHPRAMRKKVHAKQVDGMGRVETTAYSPGIFHAFKVSRIERIVTDLTGQEEIEKLKKRGITPVIVPAEDPDHNPQGKKKTAEEPELAVA